MTSFSINRLVSGGIITNYHCTSACRHCLYRSSPRRSKDYLTADKARKILRCIRNAGCHSIHIGGGEPFLNSESLARVLAAAQQARVGIEYVETNSSWFTSIDTAVDLLLRLKQQGLRTLLVSISPFHNEYIPYARIIGVMNACQKAGIHVFPWTADFEADLDSFDQRIPHRLAEYSERFGSQYLTAVLRRYWIHTGGRALDLLRPLSPPRNAHQVLTENPDSCASEL